MWQHDARWNSGLSKRLIREQNGCKRLWGAVAMAGMIGGGAAGARGEQQAAGQQPGAAEAVLTQTLGQQIWLGTMHVYERSEMPIIGTVDSRTDSLVLLQRQPTAPDIYRFKQTLCAVTLQPVGGIQMALRPGAARQLPPVLLELRLRGPHTLAGSWASGWDASDHDGDGNPGLSIQIDVPLCSGVLYLATNSRTQARVHRVGTALLGETRVELDQTILGASNPCLRLAARDRSMSLQGVFKWVPRPETVLTCDQVRLDMWPVLD